MGQQIVEHPDRFGSGIFGKQDRLLNLLTLKQALGTPAPDTDGAKMSKLLVTYG